VVRTTRGKEEEEGGEEEEAEAAAAAPFPPPPAAPPPPPPLLLLAGRPKCSFITFLNATFLASFSPLCVYTVIDGAVCLNSSSQLLNTDKGRTMRCGPRMPCCWWRWRRRAITWMVLPSPCFKEGRTEGGRDEWVFLTTQHRERGRTMRCGPRMPCCWWRWRKRAMTWMVLPSP